MKNTYNKDEAIKGQLEYVERTKSPHFAPGNGRCWNCKQNIYVSSEKRKGISVETASTSLITGCPHCNRSYCS